MSEEKYAMYIRCHNCGSDFTEKFEKGSSTDSRPVESSYCGKRGYVGHGFTARKPY